MNKRNVSRREGKATARKRNAARDLVAGKSPKVVGGSLAGSHIKVFDRSTGR